jgi:hypothetical protein
VAAWIAMVSSESSRLCAGVRTATQGFSLAELRSFQNVRGLAIA